MRDNIENGVVTQNYKYLNEYYTGDYTEHSQTLPEEEHYCEDCGERVRQIIFEEYSLEDGTCLCEDCGLLRGLK